MLATLAIRAAMRGWKRTNRFLIRLRNWLHGYGAADREISKEQNGPGARPPNLARPAEPAGGSSPPDPPVGVFGDVINVPDMRPTLNPAFSNLPKDTGTELSGDEAAL